MWCLCFLICNIATPIYFRKGLLKSTVLYFLSKGSYYFFLSQHFTIKKKIKHTSKWKELWHEHLYIHHTLHTSSHLIYFFWPCHTACGILVPQPWIEPGPRQWKHRVLTTGPPGNSPIHLIFLMHLLQTSEFFILKHFNMHVIN